MILLECSGTISAHCNLWLRVQKEREEKFLIIHLLKPNSDDSSHSFSIKPCSITDEELASSVEGETF
ncbi:hypothetical protein AAY473_024098 [Plecturocebus cupreus]